MRVGVIVPQGWTGEYDGWDPARAWARSVSVAHEAETLGFDSLWMFDHVQTEPVPTDEITFEGFTSISALAAETARVRLGHLGLGAGWKEDEFLAYGFGLPSLRERLALLEDTLEITTRMLAPGRSTYQG